MREMRTKHPDAKIIEQLGGYAMLAKRLELSPQRVHNWQFRGIPATVKLAHYDLFLRDKP